MTLKASEFIQNPNGSIYHLNLLPEHIATTIITVGDPDRVQEVTKYFDHIEVKIKKREFHTQTGTYRGNRITVISTGIGTDNIDIVFNELDALVNIDFNSREIKEHKTSLDIIRIGTSGAIQPEIPVDSFVVSDTGVGFDALLHFYESFEIQDEGFSRALVNDLGLSPHQGIPYVVKGDPTLLSLFNEGYIPGVTITNCGFYGPQGRVLRLALKDPDLNNKIEAFSYKGKKITNLEMETAGIYGLAKLMGHRSISLNAIIANRATGEFSLNSVKAVDYLIQSALQRLVTE
ncbi:nucleoside phosphorylase [soil metagenome]